MKFLLIVAALALGTNVLAQDIDGRFILESGPSKCPKEIVATSTIFPDGIEVLVESYYKSYTIQKTYKSGSARSGRALIETTIKGGVITQNIYEKIFIMKKLIHGQTIAIKPVGSTLYYDLVLKNNNVHRGVKFECGFMKQ
jgi:hypothetical protein